MTRPKIAPAVAAALTARVPPRLTRKLDVDPDLACRWTWTDDIVTTDLGETVRLVVTDGLVADVTCTCLLESRCHHVAAVVAQLELAEVEAETVEAVVEAAPTTRARGDDKLVASAAEAQRVLAELLAGGAESAGAFAQAELLRSIHTCRAVGLHRLGTAQTRVLRLVRELRGDRPEFSLATLTAEMREALGVAHALAAGDVTPVLRGAARREYESAGALRLFGLCSEPVVTRSGYAGVVTYLVDERGVIYSRADVAPGDASRAASAYDAPASIGDAVLPHRELGRAGLFVADATVSLDRRLGAGAKVRAVRASEPARWTDAPLARRWSTPFVEQLAAVAAHDGTPEDLRPAGWNLVFVDATVAGHVPGGLSVVVEDRLVETRAASTVGVARDNLTALAKAPSLRVRIVARVRLAVPRQLELVAVGPAPGEARWPLPAAMQGRANVAYDRLAVPALDARVPVAAPALEQPDTDALAPLRRRIERVVQGGAGTLSAHAGAEVDREARVLVEQGLRGGSDVLRELAVSASGRDRLAFARAWLRAALYEIAARRRFGIAAW